MVVDGERSNYTHVVSGVPQGTVLGPLLFLCHINDLPDNISSQVRLFADDCLLYRPIKSRRDHYLLQQDIHNLESWSTKWGMRFNSKKCYVLSNKCKSPHMYTINDNILQQVQNSRYLGVTISDDFKWGIHIQSMTAKASSVLGLLKRNLKHCPSSCKQLGYTAMVRSQLEYASIIWSPYQRDDINRIEKVQRRAARFISGDYTSRHEGYMSGLLAKLNLPSLESRRRSNRLAMMYNVVNNNLPAVQSTDHLTKLSTRRRIIPTQYKGFETSNIIRNQVNNNSKAFRYINCKTPQYRQSFFPYTIIEWNGLREEIVESSNLDIFRRRLTHC